MDVIEQFGDHVNVIATDGGVLVQIMQKSASKEEAVQWVLDDFGVKSENVMVFGDDFNDLGLFHKCGFPIAMENAIFELKNCAKHTLQNQMIMMVLLLLLRNLCCESQADNNST